MRRLGGVALTLAGVTGTLRVADLIAGPPVVLDASIRWCLLAIALASCLALYLAIRRQWITLRQALILGLAFQVEQALLSAIAFHATGMAEGVQIRGWTPVAVWMTLYPLMIPAPTPHVVIASLLCAAADVLGLFINVLAGAPAPSAPAAVHLFLPTVLACVAAPVISRIVDGLTIEVRRAKEMGSYRLVKRLGQGGMGDVWRAEHKMLARPAALKLIRPELLGDAPDARAAVVRRFCREARDTAALRSVHTVNVYDFGVTDDGAFFYVMELLDGLSLDALVRRYGPIRPARAVHLLRQACHSLGEAHTAGLIHRDVKPANIFVCRQGPDLDFVKVLDFGLLKHTTGPTGAGVTVQGVAMGTPAYISPEVALGVAGIDGRSDIYGLGCVAYWLLTGREVFESESAIGSIVAHIHTPPVRAAQRTTTASLRRSTI